MKTLRRQWEEKEQFPPYEFSLEMGKEMFAKPFRNGKRYADCFPTRASGSGKTIPISMAMKARSSFA